MGASSTRPAVLEWLQRHANEPHFVSDMAKELELTEDQVRSAVTNSIRENTAGAGKQLEVMIRGRQYIWHSNNGADSKTLFELVRELKNGTLLLESDTGELYQAYQIVTE